MESSEFENVSRVARLGNHLCLPIPQKCVDQLELQEGQPVSVRINGNSITTRPLKARKRWTEEELLKGVTPEMCGPDLIPDRAGKEIL